MKPRFLLAALVAALTAGTAFAADDSMVIRSRRAQAEAFAGAPVEYVQHRPLRDNSHWEALGDHALLIWETRSKAWFVELEKEPRCRDLNGEYLMELESKVDWLSTRNGYINLQPGHGWCKIIGIRPVDVPALRADRHALASAR
jgi:hypothetical protein